MKCPVCGNEVNLNYTRCPFCGAVLGGFSNDSENKKMIIYNIEKSFPICKEAERLLHNKIFDERKKKVKVIKLIHGYGSSGKGGELRFCLREYLSFLKQKGVIRFWVSGEEFCSTSNSGKKILGTFRWLRSDFDYNRKNKGITLIVL